MANTFLKNTSYELASGEWTPRVLIRTFMSEGIKNRSLRGIKCPLKKKRTLLRKQRLLKWRRVKPRSMIQLLNNN